MIAALKIEVLKSNILCTTFSFVHSGKTTYGVIFLIWSYAAPFSEYQMMQILPIFSNGFLKHRFSVILCKHYSIQYLFL